MEKLVDIKQIIKTEVERHASTKIEAYDDEIFFKSTVLDSLNMLNLIVFLEHKFQLEIDAFFDDRESVGSINKLASYIKLKLDSKTPQ